MRRIRRLRVLRFTRLGATSCVRFCMIKRLHRIGFSSKLHERSAQKKLGIRAWNERERSFELLDRLGVFARVKMRLAFNEKEARFFCALRRCCPCTRGREEDRAQK
jgi:hypothetical protein